MKTPPLRLVALAVLLLPAATGRAQQASATGANQLVNVATAAFGAKGTGVGENLVQGEKGSLASAGAAQPAFTVINLAGEVEMNRVALEVGNQKGKLRVVALKDDGTPDLSSGRVITEFNLDGNAKTVSADVNDVKVKRVAIVWVPDAPGQVLTLNNVGLFTSKPEVITSLPEVRAIAQSAPAAAPATAAASAASTTAPAAAPATAPAAPASSGNSGAAAGGAGNSSSAAAAATPPVTSPTSTAAGAATPANPGQTTAAPVQPLSTPAANNVPSAAPVPPQTRNVSR